MPFKPLVTAGIESLLNTFLYRSPALKTARSRLLGKVLRVEVKGFSTSLILVFSERQVDVLGEWAGDADCTVIAYASVLPKLRDRQQRYVAEAITEEWRMAPGPLEVAWFAEETAAVERAVDALTKRLEKLEAK